MSVQATEGRGRELSKIERPIGDTVELRVEVDVRELSPPRVNYVLDKAQQAESWLQAFLPEGVGVEDVYQRSQGSEAHAQAGSDLVEAYATVDVSGVPEERVNALVEAVVQMEAWFFEQVEGVRATARAN